MYTFKKQLKQRKIRFMFQITAQDDMDNGRTEFKMKTKVYMQTRYGTQNLAITVACLWKNKHDKNLHSV